jgi:hypothetical protein
MGTRSDVSSQAILHVWSSLLTVGRLGNCLQLVKNRNYTNNPKTVGRTPVSPSELDRLVPKRGFRGLSSGSTNGQQVKQMIVVAETKSA